MPLVYSKLCSKDSAWAGMFARSTRSSVLSASVIASEGYHLAFLIDFHRTQSRQIID